MFLQGFVQNIVSILDRNRLIAADFSGVSEADISLVFEFCFAAMVHLEDHGGLTVDGQTYFVHLAFSPELANPARLFTSQDRTVLHGGLNDEIITAALKAVLPASTGTLNT